MIEVILRTKGGGNPSRSKSPNNRTKSPIHHDKNQRKLVDYLDQKQDNIKQVNIEQ